MAHRFGEGVGHDGLEEGEDSSTADGPALLHVVQDLVVEDSHCAVYTVQHAVSYHVHVYSSMALLVWCGAL